jgi:peptidoglycan/xylan/chitin deacetylase (PgdA/CDA1 family)
VAAAGNYQANHACGHSSLPGINQTQFNNEINDSNNAIQNATNGQDQSRVKPLYLRPPDGSSDVNTSANSEAFSYEIVLWDIDPQDWH